MRYSDRMGRQASPEYTPKRAAADLHQALAPRVNAGITAFIRDEIDPS